MGRTLSIATDGFWGGSGNSTINNYILPLKAKLSESELNAKLVNDNYVAKLQDDNLKCKINNPNLLGKIIESNMSVRICI